VSRANRLRGLLDSSVNGAVPELAISDSGGHLWNTRSLRYDEHVIPCVAGNNQETIDNRIKQTA
jgi:hypothetical protein